MKEHKYQMKKEFEERMKKLLPDLEDFKKFEEIVNKPVENYIRANTIKISPSELKARLSKRWQIEHPFSSYPEIFLIKSQLLPGELGKSIEHLLGCYYIQELSSMMPVLALNPSPHDMILDLCASPGSKTTQIASLMQNSGLIIANDKKIGRISILNANLERTGVTNTIITRHDGVNLCERLLKGRLSEGNRKVSSQFNKILVDAPCSGEGTLRSTPETFWMWSKNMIKYFSSLQKKLLISAIPLLKENGILVYSTCTHNPKENEEVVNFAIEKFPELELEEISLPIKCREGVSEWQNQKFPEQIKKCVRIYPQDNNTEGFFIAKFVKNGKIE